MSVNLGFNPATVVPNYGGGGGFPVSDEKGWLVIATASEMKPTRGNTGNMLVFTLVGQEGPVNGKTAEYRLNLQHQSQQAVDIAWGQLSAMAAVTGTGMVNASGDLHNKPFRVVVVQNKDDARYTEIIGVRDVNGNKPGAAGQGPQMATTAPAAPPAPPPGMAPAGGYAPQQQPPAGMMPQQQPPQPATWGAPAPGQPQQPQQGAWQGQPTQPAPQQPPQQQGAPGWSGPPQGAPAGAPNWAQG